MPGKRCTVATCHNSAQKTTGSGIIYHSFPKNASIRAIWVQRCKREGKWNPDSCSVCSTHFKESDYQRDLKSELLNIPIKKRLKADAVPSVNLPQSSSVSNSNMQKKKYQLLEDRKHRLERRSRKRAVSELLATDTSTLTSFSSENPACSNIKGVDEPETPPNPVDNNMANRKEDFVEKEMLLREIEQLKEENRKLKIETAKLKNVQSSLKRKIKNRTVRELKTDSHQAFPTSTTDFTVEKVFKIVSPTLTRTQVEKIVLRKKKIVWKTEDISRALTLRYLGKRSYLYLRDMLQMPLPALSTLRRWASKLDMRPGLLKQVVEVMKIASTKMEEKDKYVVINFDEVKVNSCYEYDTRADQVLGRHNQMQVSIVRGLLSNWKQPIYFAFDQKMTTDILFLLIRELHNASFIVIACVSDCGGGNVGLWKTLNVNIDRTYFENPITGEHIYMFADVPHLLKLIRNWLIDTGFVLESGDFVNKVPLQALLKINTTEINVCHNLSDIHINCAKFQRQNVRLAAQLLSHKTAKALLFYKPGECAKLAEDTGKFIELVDQWFDLLNTYKINKFSVPWKSAYGLQLDQQNELLDKVNNVFRTMRCCNKNQLQIFQKGVLITNSSIKALLEDLKKRLPGIEYLLTHKVNQDCLENFFSHLRLKGGFNDHPSPLDAMYRMRMIILGKNAGAVQSNLNTIDKSEEDFVVARVFRETEVTNEIDNHEGQKADGENIELLSNSSDISATGEGCSTPSNISEGCEEDGLRYLAGYIAKKFIHKFPELGNYAKTIVNNPSAPSSWLQKISFGNLVHPSDLFFCEILKYEKMFRLYHRSSVRLHKGVVKMLARKIHKKYDKLDLEIITAYVRQRTFIRINFLNKVKSREKAYKKKLNKVVN